MYEKRFAAVSPQLFTVDGSSAGQLTIADTRLFKVKQKVIIKADSLPNIELEVKRIDSINVMYVGSDSGNIDFRTDISAYTVALNAAVFANEQKRTNIPEQEIERLTYEEEPTVARRVTIVDPLGDLVSEKNPLPVAAVFDGDVKVGDIRITANDDDPAIGDLHSSVRIGDGTNEVKVNADGSLNVVIPPSAGGIFVNQFSEISSVPSGSLTDILTYVVPVSYTGTLCRVEVGGNNVATYEIYKNTELKARIRTWFGTALTHTCEFSSGTSGPELVAGDTIKIKVIHNRPFTGDFEARLQIQLQ